MFKFWELGDSLIRKTLQNPETTGGSLVLNFFMKNLEWEFMTKSKNCP